MQIVDFLFVWMKRQHRSSQCNYQLFWLMILRTHTDIIADKPDNNQWDADAASVLEPMYCPQYEELQQEILNNIFDSFGNSSLSEL